MGRKVGIGATKSNSTITKEITMTPEVKARIDEMVQNNKIMIFMKGNKLMPQCGFSNNVVQIMNVMGVPFETFDILADPEIRQGIKDYSNWPTIPQVYLNGEFLGGSDIMIELYQSGELQQMVEVALAS
jgi:monothiol glutaredoxin